MKLHTKRLIFLWIAVLLFASANSVIDKLGQLGVEHPINGNNPISFCNVLFVGNLIGGIMFVIVYYKSWRPPTFQSIRPQQWKGLTLSTLCLSILGPTFFFLAIQNTSVINVILISTTEIAWVLILGYLIFREKPSILTIVGALLASVGAVVTFVLYQEPQVPLEVSMMQANVGSNVLKKFMANTSKIGDIFTALAAFFTILGQMLSKKYMADIPDYIYTTFRTFVGAIIFFLFAIILFGWSHFADLFSPFLWKWMLLYGGIIIAMSVFTFSKAVKGVYSKDMAIANAFFPVASVIFAYIILDDIPVRAQIIGGAIILIGIVIGLYDNLRNPQPMLTANEKIMGFKGI